MSTVSKNLEILRNPLESGIEPKPLELLASNEPQDDNKFQLAGWMVAKGVDSYVSVPARLVSGPVAGFLDAKDNGRNTAQAVAAGAFGIPVGVATGIREGVAGTAAFVASPYVAMSASLDTVIDALPRDSKTVTKEGWDGEPFTYEEDSRTNLRAFVKDGLSSPIGSFAFIPEVKDAEGHFEKAGAAVVDAINNVAMMPAHLVGTPAAAAIGAAKGMIDRGGAKLALIPVVVPAAAGAALTMGALGLVIDGVKATYHVLAAAWHVTAGAYRAATGTGSKPAADAAASAPAEATTTVEVNSAESPDVLRLDSANDVPADADTAENAA